MDYTFVQEALLRHFTPEKIGKGVFNTRTRTALAALDFEFFCRYYLSHHFISTPADFHRALFLDVEEMMATKKGQNYLSVVFRGGAKTTIFNLAFPLWCICLKKRHFITIVSDSERMAREKSATIKYEIETNESIKEDFGDLGGPKWADTEFETSSRIKVLALGSGMNIRGAKYGQHRPDLIILDDIESRDEVNSPAQRRRLSSWFNQDVLAAGQPDTKIVVIGTYLAYDCVLKEMEQAPIFWRRRNFPAIAKTEDGFAFALNQNMWDEWEVIIRDLSNPNREKEAEAFYLENEVEMLEGVECAWPERLSYYDMMVKRLAGRTEFNTEYLNEPSDPASRYFARYFVYKRMMAWEGELGPWLVPWSKDGPTGQPVKLAACVLFAATDPSMGMSVQADYSAILILALDPKTGYRYVLEADLQRRPPSKIIEDQIRWYEKYPNIVRWTIETVQMQAFFREQSGVQSLMQGKGLPLVDYKTGATNKHLRIQSLQAPLENGYILLCADGQELLKEQLEQYPHTTHDDGPDALEMVYVISLGYQVEYAPAVTEGERYQFGNMYALMDSDPYDEMDRLADNRERLEKALRGEKVEGPVLPFAI